MKDINFESGFDYEGDLPWCNDLSSEDLAKVKKIPPTAMEKLHELGVTHWNSIAQSVANSIKNAGVSREGLTSILETSGIAYDGVVTARDIDKVITNAFDEEFNGRRAVKWPDHDLALSRKIIENHKGVDLEDHGFTTDCPREILAGLYRPTDLLNMAPKALSNGETKTLKIWLDEGIDGMNFIVPSPMSTKEGPREIDGKPSPRCKANSGPRVIQVVEFDSTPLDDQPAILDHLATIAPLVLVVRSGGKSLHGHFKMSHLTENQQMAFMRYAVTLGADKALWSRHQYCRLAGGQEKGRGKQEVIMFNPEGSEADIANLPAEKESLEIISGDALNAKHPEKPQALIHGLVGVGDKLMLSSGSKAGKTFALMGLAKAVSEGADWFGFKTEKGKVLYLNFELTEAWMAERVRYLDPENRMRGVDFVNLRGRDIGFDQLTQELEGRTGEYKLIVLDPIYKVLGDVNENDNGEVAKLLNKIEKMAYRMGATVGYGHHFSKGNKSGTDQIDRASGAGSWSRDPDAILTLSPHEMEDCYVLEATVRNYKAPEDSVWRRQFPSFIREEGADPSKLKKKHGGANRKGGAETVVDHLDFTRPMKKADLVKELAKERKVHPKTAGNWVKSAEESGQIVLENGLFQLPVGD